MRQRPLPRQLAADDLDGRSRYAAPHRPPVATQNYGRSRLGAAQPGPTLQASASPPRDVGARRVAAPELRSIMSLASEGARAQDNCERQRGRGPRQAGATAADVWAHMRPQRCIYSEMAACACSRCLQHGCDAAHELSGMPAKWLAVIPPLPVADGGGKGLGTVWPCPGLASPARKGSPS